MAQEGIHKHAYWLYGVIVGLAIREALGDVLRHALTPPFEQGWVSVPEALRLAVFLIVTIRYYLGSAVFFEVAYLSADSDTNYPRKNYTIDFLVVLMHFLIFFSWAISIDVHTKPARLFPALLAFILFYDGLWFLACKRYDTSRVIKLWSAVSIAMLVVSIAVYFAASYFQASQAWAEGLAFIPVIIASLISISETTRRKQIFAEWLTKLLSRQ